MSVNDPDSITTGIGMLILVAVGFTVGFTTVCVLRPPPEPAKAQSLRIEAPIRYIVLEKSGEGSSTREASAAEIAAYRAALKGESE